MSAQLGFDVHVVEAHEVQHVTVSSTIVRRKLQDEGDIIFGKRVFWVDHTSCEVP